MCPLSLSLSLILWPHRLHERLSEEEEASKLFTRFIAQAETIGVSGRLDKE